MHGTEVAYLLLTQLPQVSSPPLPIFSEEKLSTLLRLFNGAGERKVNSGLKMLIEPIWFWVVDRQFYKKDQFNQADLQQHWLEKNEVTETFFARVVFRDRNKIFYRPPRSRFESLSLSMTLERPKKFWAAF